MRVRYAIKYSKSAQSAPTECFRLRRFDMKKANFNAGSAIGGFKRWFGGNMITMRSAW